MLRARASKIVFTHGVIRKLALPKEVEHWSLNTLREKPIKIGAQVVRHGRYITLWS